MNILVVDDEYKLGRLLSVGLASYGYHVIIATNGKEALEKVAILMPDAVILDIELGVQPDGLTVCRQLREWSDVPVIMLSVRNDERTKVTALDAGADDYLTKPFGMEELRARIQAVLRRKTTELPIPQPEIRIGELLIDLVNRLVFVHGQQVHLTPKEYELLRLLATNPNKVMTHQQLLVRVWGEEYAQMDHYVRVFINQLRKKLQEDPANGIRYIQNEPGVGYRWIAEKS